MGIDKAIIGYGKMSISFKIKIILLNEQRKELG